MARLNECFLTLRLSVSPGVHHRAALAALENLCEKKGVLPDIMLDALAQRLPLSRATTSGPRAPDRRVVGELRCSVESDGVPVGLETGSGDHHVIGAHRPTAHRAVSGLVFLGSGCNQLEPVLCF